MTALAAAALSPVERKLAAYGKGGRLSRTLSRVIAAFRPLQMVSCRLIWWLFLRVPRIQLVLQPHAQQCHCRLPVAADGA